MPILNSMDTATRQLIETIRDQALSISGLDVGLAHLCSFALNGERWAEERILDAVAHDELDTVDVTRPDGLIPRTLLSI